MRCRRQDNLMDIWCRNDEYMYGFVSLGPEHGDGFSDVLNCVSLTNTPQLPFNQIKLCLFVGLAVWRTNHLLPLLIRGVFISFLFSFLSYQPSPKNAIGLKYRQWWNTLNSLIKGNHCRWLIDNSLNKYLKLIGTWSWILIGPTYGILFENDYKQNIILFRHWFT